MKLECLTLMIRCVISITSIRKAGRGAGWSREVERKCSVMRIESIRRESHMGL